MINFPLSSGVPLNYDSLNFAGASYSPSTLHCKNTQLTSYFARYLLQKTMSVFKWTLPETWDMNYFLYTLYTYGFLCVFYHDKYGVIPQGCGVQGYNIFYQPTEVLITNPNFSGNITRKIGRDCIIMRLQPDWQGIMDIVYYYADNMALTAESCEINIANTKLAYMFGVDNKQQAETMKSIFDKIQSGETAVFYNNSIRRRTANGDTSEPWNVFSQNIRDTFIAPELQDTLRRWEEMFCNEIGINNVRSDKKERLITAEAESNDFECRSKCEMWLEELQKACKKINDMFGEKMNERVWVEWRKGNYENASNIRNSNNSSGVG